MSELQKNKLLQKKIVASKWFGTAKQIRTCESKSLFVLSIAKAMVYHHAVRVYTINNGNAVVVSHHTFRCVSKSAFAMMIYKTSS